MPSHNTKYGTLFEFQREDVFRNTLETHPRVNLYIYSSSIYYNNETRDSTNFHTPDGHINLYDLNVNRQNVSASGDTQLIYPFLTKNGSFSSFATISDSSYNLDFAFGATVTGSYPMTSSIIVERYGTTLSGRKKKVLYSLRNSLDFYSVLSPHYAYSSSLGNKEAQKINMINVPSIFYGSSIEKGTVVLKYFVTGTLIAEASDTLKDGVLYQTSGSTTGSSVGVALYNEGILLLTSSANLDTHGEAYTSAATNYSASWHYFGTTDAFSGAPSSSFSLDFNGTSNVQALTMFAHAEENYLNFSNNPTFLTGAIAAVSSSNVYHEDAEAEIKNIVTSSYANYSASFQPVTYISKVGIYDEDKNLIAVASLANPVRKIEGRSYTFKLKLDI
jgi:hypothetical protein